MSLIWMWHHILGAGRMYILHIAYFFSWISSHSEVKVQSFPFQKVLCICVLFPMLIWKMFGDSVCLTLKCQSLNWTEIRAERKKANIMTGQKAFAHHMWLAIFSPSILHSVSPFCFPSVAPSNAVHSSLFAHAELSLWIPCLTFPKPILISQAIVMELFSWKPQRKSRGYD